MCEQQAELQGYGHSNWKRPKGHFYIYLLKQKDLIIWISENLIYNGVMMFM